MEKAQHLVPVEIYGHAYNLRGEGDTAYINGLAEFVDQKMREIADQTATIDSLKVAILAALNIADQHFQFKSAETEHHQTVSERMGRLVGILDRDIIESTQG